MFAKISFISLTVILLIVGVTACRSSSGAPSDDQSLSQVSSTEGSPIGAPQVTDEPADSLIRSFWEMGPHAQTYVLSDDGTNSTCARCHAPLDYVPSMDDMPESCASCKFEIDPPPPVIVEASWRDIPCNVCHRVKKGNIDPEYAWLSIPPIDEYDDVATATELCRKCHLEVDTLSEHVMIEFANTHTEYTCVQCHDAHTTQASCVTENCHADIWTLSPVIPGHDDVHKMVACPACHDASGLAVGPIEDGMWFAFLPESSIPFASHAIAREAPCERCHFPNNPWDLVAEITFAP